MSGSDCLYEISQVYQVERRSESCLEELATFGQGAQDAELACKHWILLS